MTSTRLRRVRSAMLAFLLGLAVVGTIGCGAPQTDSTSGSQTDDTEQEAITQDTEFTDTSADERQASYDKALAGEGVVSTFIGEKFYDGKVTDENAALEAIQSVISRIGGDETTKLELDSLRPTEDGLSYYVFRQRAGDVLVHGASVKLITNRDGEAVGLLSAIMPDVKAPDLATWAATQETAEDAVRTELAASGVKGVSVLSEASEQTLIPLEDASDRYRYAWVVYTKNYYDDVDMAYLAHYVSEDGEYLYAIPVVEPNNEDALAGDKANFDFDQYEQGEKTFEVTLHDGSTEEITVPVLTRPDSEEVILADSSRKILCADYTKFQYGDLAPCASTDDSFDDRDLLAYETFVRVWDSFDEIGWTGPDSDGTPSLLLMDYVDENGEPEDNAFYSGRQYGFQTFAFGHVTPFGEDTDVIAHEFTHCVTGTTMTTNLYLNDYGAINEGMSDVMGNLVEMRIDDNPGGAWVIGEGAGEDKIMRSMKDPHAYLQPEFTWDVYYQPAVAEGTDLNDNGGVHTNSSLLNIVSYKLDQAGMTPEDQQYFWMNVALAMTPFTDYEQMADLLPWCMEQAGYPQYVEPLQKAIGEAKYSVANEPRTPAEGTGIVSISFADQDLAQEGDEVLLLLTKDGKGQLAVCPSAQSSVAKLTVPEGDYYGVVVKKTGGVQTMLLYSRESADNAWSEVDELDVARMTDANLVHVVDGATTELPEA